MAGVFHRHRPWDKERAQLSSGLHNPQLSAESKTCCCSECKSCLGVASNPAPQKVIKHFANKVRAFQRSCCCSNSGSTELREAEGLDFHHQFPSTFGKLTTCLYLYTLSSLCSYERENCTQITHRIKVPSLKLFVCSCIGEPLTTLYCKPGLCINISFQNITPSQH